MAVVCGKISGNLECLDFDDADKFRSWAESVKKQGGLKLLKKLVIVQTPEDGFHAYYRCREEVEGNQKLAQREGPDGRPRVLIETRGEGGYAILPGSPLECHPTGKPYILRKGDLAQPAVLTMDERYLLLSSARALNEWVEPTQLISGVPFSGRAPSNSGTRPGDDFDQRVEWMDILGPHGWTVVGFKGSEVTYLRRPGKTTGMSATVNFGGTDHLHVFTTNAYPFEAQRGYTKFAAYALLEHGGNFAAAAADLSEQGYGEKGSGRTRPAEAPLAEITSWPSPPDERAFYGLAGDIVRSIEPHSEADPVGLLGQCLVAFGNCIGQGSHFLVESDQHSLNLYLCLVGTTAKGRKGTSWGHIRNLFERVDEAWTKQRIVFGFSSGEGVIFAVRDAIERQEPIKEKGRVTSYQTVRVDPGVDDKRLLIQEAEFASPLRLIRRDGNILSPILRCAWDTGELRTLTKNSPTKATAAHISVIGHITKQELIRYLDSTEAGNGFGNRFLWMCVRRSKLLPEGGRIHETNLDSLVVRLQQAIRFARSEREITRDAHAGALWRKVYPALSEGKPGLLGAMIARSEAQVMRLACIYALLDLSDVIRKAHLLAALALWNYCESACRFIFGTALGDPLADEILEALRNKPRGLTRTDIRDLFGRNKSRTNIDRALSVLVEQGMATFAKERSGGRPVERWFVMNTISTTKTT